MSNDLDDLAVLNRLRAEIDAVPSSLEVNHIEAGGARRVRRRRLASAAGTVAALAFVGGAGYAGTQILDRAGAGTQVAASAPSAGGASISPASATQLPGCTLRPSTCDALLVAGWSKQSGLPFVAGTFKPLTGEPGEEALPRSGVGYRGEYTEQGTGRVSTLEVLVTADEGGSGLWHIRSGEPTLPWQPSRTLTVRSGVIATVDSLTHDRFYELWTIPSGTGHGALAVAVEGPERPAGWTDAAVVDLLVQILTVPPR